MTAPDHTPSAPIEQEEWRPVVGYEGWYEVSSLGRVRRVMPGPRTSVGRFLKPGSNLGYPSVNLFKDGTRQFFKVHILVTSSFLGPCPVGHEVNHKDGNKGNPVLSNLEYVTRSENLQHAYDHGLKKPLRGEMNGNASLADEQAAAILASAERNGVLARRFGVSKSTIESIRRGRRYAHVRLQQGASE